MSVLDEVTFHNVQVWNGVCYSMVSPDTAHELEKAGTHQITTNLQAKDLMTAGQLKELAKSRRQEPAPKKQKATKSSEYKTKVVKAEE